ncbi:MAG: extracellular solute-binding protein [Gammaproteobacteria bacterium]|nr:extracellular solute-binding protein [Gammaproteobacteria bacterium]
MRYISLILISALLPLSGAQSADELLVYSGRSDKFVKPVVEAFTQQTGIKVVLHAGSSTALLNKLQLEGKRTKADIYISNDAGNLQKGADLKLFRTLPKSIYRNIPSNYRSAQNDWLGLSARARVLVVNSKDASAKGIKSVFDLANKDLRGKIALTHSGNESYIAGVTVYMQGKGKKFTKKWLSGMKQNLDDGVFNKHSKIVKAVASGKKVVGLVNHYYIYRHLEKHPKAPIHIVVPDQGRGELGVAWNVAGAAITKHSKQAKLAEKLMTFMVSNDGQKLFANVNREYPTRPGISASKEIPAVGTFKVADVPMAKLGTLRNATLDLIEAAGMP